MTRVSCNSFRLLLLAFIPLCASVGVARADIEQSFNFKGVLTQPVNGGTSVTGQFTIDFTSDTITAFNFSTPIGNLSPGTSEITTEQGVSPSPIETFTVLEFLSNAQTLALFFEDPPSAFSASSFYTDPVTISDGNGESNYTCLDPIACSGASDEKIGFSRDSRVTPVPSAVPEPRSALLLVGVLLFTICAIRWKAKPVGSF